MSDVTRPVKARLPEFVRAEERLLALLFDTLVEAQPTPAQWQTVTEIDNAMLSAEFLHLIGWSRIFSICTPVCAAKKARFR